MRNIFSFCKRNALTLLTVWVCALIVSNSAVNAAQSWAPFGRFLSDVNTAMCTDTGSGLCVDATGTLVGMADPNNEAHTWTGAQTYSGLVPFKLSADTSAGATGVLFTVANGTQSATVPELGISYSSTTGTNGCPDTSIGSTNLLLVITGANTAHETKWACTGSVTFGNNITVSGNTTTAAIFPSGGITSTASGTQFTCNISTTCEEDYATTTAPGVTYKMTGGGLTGTAVNFRWMTGGTPTETLDLLGNGGLTELTGDFTNTVGNIIVSAGNITDTAGNVSLSATTTGNGQVKTCGAATANGAGVVLGNGCHLDQGATAGIAGACTFSASTTCTATMTQAFITAGRCFAQALTGQAYSNVSNLTFQVTNPTTTTTFTITAIVAGAATAESGIVNWFCVGDPK